MLRFQSHSVLLTKAQIQQRVNELGKRISMDYKSQDLVLLCVLKGSAVFLADLMREISIPVRCEFLQVASYGEGVVSSGNIHLTRDIQANLHCSDILIVEDIVDTGQSLNFLANHLRVLQSAKVKVCSLLDKSKRRIAPITIDYVGFEIPDVFVVGYGLDYDQQYRNLPYIAVLDLR